MASNASQYLSKLLGAMTSGKIIELKEKQLKRIAAIVTGLTILGNPKFHEVIKLQPGEFEKIKAGLTSKQVADRVATIGTRSPSMLAQNEQTIVHWKTRSADTKTTFAKKVKQLALDIDASQAPVAAKVAEGVEDGRIDINVDGDWSTRVFFTATLKNALKTWLHQKDQSVKHGEATVDLNPHTKAAYISRIDAYPVQRGFGTEMLQQVITQCIDHGYATIRAYVESGNINSKHMLESNGFKTIKSTPHGAYWELAATTTQEDVSLPPPQANLSKPPV